MGDMSELRTIVVVVAFLICTVSLIGLMVGQSPTIFGDVSDTGVSPITGEKVNPSNLIDWNETYVINLTVSIPSVIQTFKIGGWNMRVMIEPVVTGVFSGTNFIKLQSFDWWWLGEYNQEDFIWYNSSNQRVSQNDVGIQGIFFNTQYPEMISETMLDYNYNNVNGSSSLSNLVYKVKNGKTQLTLSFNFNNTLYSSPSNCLHNGGSLAMVFTVNWNDRNTGMNALEFISRLFTFSLPGVNPFITALILSPIYGALGYLAFIFVLRIIGAVFGGGGA